MARPARAEMMTKVTFMLTVGSLKRGVPYVWTSQFGRIWVSCGCCWEAKVFGAERSVYVGGSSSSLFVKAPVLSASTATNAIESARDQYGERNLSVWT
jgi:hypothetical protein